MLWKVSSVDLCYVVCTVLSCPLTPHRPPGKISMQDATYPAWINAGCADVAPFLGEDLDWAVSKWKMMLRHNLGYLFLPPCVRNLPL